LILPSRLCHGLEAERRRKDQPILRPSPVTRPFLSALCDIKRYNRNVFLEGLDIEMQPATNSTLVLIKELLKLRQEKHMDCAYTGRNDHCMATSQIQGTHRHGGRPTCFL